MHSLLQIKKALETQFDQERINWHNGSALKICQYSLPETAGVFTDVIEPKALPAEVVV
jgi:hypothetical protein